MIVFAIIGWSLFVVTVAAWCVASIRAARERECVEAWWKEYAKVEQHFLANAKDQRDAARAELRGARAALDDIVLRAAEAAEEVESR